MKKAAIVLLALFAVWWMFLRTTPAEAPGEGIRTTELPEQHEVKEDSWTTGKYTVKPLASYTIRARVLGKKRYYFDHAADIAPIDLALGWGPMSDSGVLSHLNISQGDRWYEYYYSAECPASSYEIAISSANVHCLPANNTVKSDLFHLRVNSFAELKGYLVEVRKEGAPPWTSSLTRNDTGNGACEIFWVTSVEEFLP